MTDRRDTVVVNGGNSSTGLILGIIVLIVVLAGAWYFLLGPGAGSTTNPSPPDVNVELPTAPPVDIPATPVP